MINVNNGVIDEKSEGKILCCIYQNQAIDLITQKLKSGIGETCIEAGSAVSRVVYRVCQS